MLGACMWRGKLVTRGRGQLVQSASDPNIATWTSLQSLHLASTLTKSSAAKLPAEVLLTGTFSEFVLLNFVGNPLVA